MTAEMIDSWCASGANEINRSKSPAVQRVEVIKNEAQQRLESLHRVADGVYTRWIAGLSG